MKRVFVAGMWIGVCALMMMEARPALAQAQKHKVVTECLFSGPVGTMTGSAVGDPVRYEIDKDSRAVLIVHKVQMNHDFNDPFKPKILVEKPTCRLKLDCVISKQGLKDIGVQSTRQESSDPNIWTRVGFAVTLKYDNESRNTTCHILAIDYL